MFTNDKIQEKLNDLVLPVFSRHETFHPRFGWLKKGFDKAQIDPEVFLRDNATTALGVGKNMVKSIRYWCSAFKLLYEVPAEGRAGRLSIPTELGEKLLGVRGWDPYLEDVASLWLLHWNLIKPTCQAATWFFVFNIFPKKEFTTNDIQKELRQYTALTFPNLKVAEASLANDVHCLLRMYVSQNNLLGPIEDSINSPFNELSLIQSTAEAHSYIFNTEHKVGLPPEIIVASCLEYAHLLSPESKTISIAKLLYDRGSPGLAFKLSETQLCTAIEAICSKVDNITLSDTAGLVQFSFSREPNQLKDELLDIYYRRR